MSDVTKPQNQFFMCFGSAVQRKTCGSRQIAKSVHGAEGFYAAT